MIKRLQTEQLGVRRSERWLFRRLDLELDQGELVQITGANGAGKTTLLRTLCGLIEPNEGRVKWFLENDASPMYLGHKACVKAELTALENLLLHPVNGRRVTEEQALDALAEVGLAEYVDSPVRYLSAGQGRRVALARLLLSDTMVWVLDEPFTAIDVEGCQWLEGLISTFVSNGGAVVLTSHQPLRWSSQIRAIDIGDYRCSVSY
ncbi:MAG: cytochrome c biogenesis heme-transporting ATPase CcmA [Gammaproteobacteria bacterium]|nr:MAG: cytochrome c biogenesis heme-transporting ATPase CcmA [Gammaproteobacteria bacterium]